MSDLSFCPNCFCSLNGSAVCPECGYIHDFSAYPFALPVSTVLGGRYIIGRVLGQGGFGITYIAKDYKTGSLVAVKEYFPESLASRTGGTAVSPFSGERKQNFDYGKTCFLEEAKTLACFNDCPGIVSVFNYFEENNTAYFTMEYLSGTSLCSYLKSKGNRIDFFETMNIVFPVMDALELVHKKGIIHRDISPDNICITSDKRVVLLDFGSARYSMGEVSKSLDVVLKHGFAPKEQYARHGRQGAFTDIYALAATIYRCITGQLPPDSIDRIDNDEIIKPSALAPIPPEAERAIMKALSVQPSARYPSVADFKADLKKSFAAKKNISKNVSKKTPESGSVLTNAKPKPVKQKPASDKTDGKNIKKPVIISAACVVLAALIAVIAGVIILNNNGSSAQPSGYEYTVVDNTITLDSYTGSDINVVVPDEIDGITVTKIGENCFAGSDIESVSIPSAVTTIGRAAFSNCSNLCEVNMADGVAVIENSAFENCVSLTNVEFPDSVRQIQNWAFEGCDSLESLKIPNEAVMDSYSTFSDNHIQIIKY